MNDRHNNNDGRNRLPHKILLDSAGAYPAAYGALVSRIRLLADQLHDTNNEIARELYRAIDAAKRIGNEYARQSGPKPDDD